MITDTDKEEQISKAYIKAVAANAGYVSNFLVEEYGVDVRIENVEKDDNGKFNHVGMVLDVQTKATTNFRDIGNNFSYELKNDAYNKLVAEAVTIPRILVVLFLPRDEGWVEQTEDYLKLKKCAYWTYLKGATLAPSNRLESSTAVYLKKTHIFSAETLKTIMAEINKKKGDLNAL